MELTTEELRRYSRQVILPEIGVEGQLAICRARVLCVGAGGLGSPAALYLAAAGVGHLGIIDFDAVDLSNLHRQLLHGTSSLGRPKVESARDMIGRLNPGVRVEAHKDRITSTNALELVRGYDLVVDGSDNFPARYVVNDACVLLRKPNVYGAISRFEGQASIFAPHLGGGCYRCLYPEPPPPGTVPSCAEAGVLGVLPGLIGLIQATEALKHIIGRGDLLLNRLLLYDALAMRFREMKTRRDPACPVCGEKPTITKPFDYDQVCTANTTNSKTMHPDEITVQEMKQALDNSALGIKVIDVREPDEQKIARIEGVPLLPLSQLPQRYSELDPNQAYYLHCKAGGRSMKALQFLRDRGFKNLKSVAGGITAWSEQIDSRVPKY